MEEWMEIEHGVMWPLMEDDVSFVPGNPSSDTATLMMG